MTKLVGELTEKEIREYEALTPKFMDTLNDIYLHSNISTPEIKCSDDDETVYFEHRGNEIFLTENEAQFCTLEFAKAVAINGASAPGVLMALSPYILHNLIGYKNHCLQKQRDFQNHFNNPESLITSHDDYKRVRSLMKTGKRNN